MIYVLSFAVAALAVATWFSLSFGLRERRRRKGRPLIDRNNVPEVQAEQVSPVFARTEHGPSIASETILVGDIGAFASTSTTEAWILCALAKSAKKVFEFGTCSGRTTYLLARNMPDDGKIGTITLAPEQAAEYQTDSADPDSKTWQANAINESGYTDFYYSGTPVEGKVEQIFGDSKAFDESPWANDCDLIFIDGSHAYSYVQSDSEKALRMAKPGAFIVWHDFSPGCPGVWNYLSKLAEQHPIKHIKDTRLAVLQV